MSTAEETNSADNLKTGTSPRTSTMATSSTTKTRGTTSSRRVKTPNCTHIDMDRVYGGDQSCYVCGREPSLGFLYVCRQDLNPWPPVIYNDSSILETKRDEAKSELRQTLEEHGLSESVILTAERGEYSLAQLKKLKKQKAQLKQSIEDAIQGSHTNAMAAKLADSLPTNNDGAFNSLIGEEPILVPACQFRACHACRPYYKDRIYTSFVAITSNLHPPFSESDIRELHLPTKDARKLCHIGLIPNPLPSTTLDATTSPSTLQTCVNLSASAASSGSEQLSTSRDSIMTFQTTQTDVSDLTRMRSPRRRFYTLSNKSSASIARNLSASPTRLKGLRSAIQGIFKNSKGRESTSIDSNITLPLQRSGTARDLTVGEIGETVRELDVGPLRRVRRQKERVDLRNGTSSGSFESGRRLRNKFCSISNSRSKADSKASHREGDAVANVDEDGDTDAESSTSDFTVYSCTSEGSEVEVTGGVALTEEAVETHVPDILDTATTSGAVAYADADAGADAGLDSLIMQA